MTKQQRIDILLKENEQLLKDIYTLIDEDNVVEMIAVKYKHLLRRDTEKAMFAGTPTMTTKTGGFSTIKEKVERYRTSEEY